VQHTALTPLVTDGLVRPTGLACHVEQVRVGDRQIRVEAQRADALGSAVTQEHIAQVGSRAVGEYSRLTIGAGGGEAATDSERGSDQLAGGVEIGRQLVALGARLEGGRQVIGDAAQERPVVVAKCTGPMAGADNHPRRVRLGSDWHDRVRANP